MPGAVPRLQPAASDRAWEILFPLVVMGLVTEPKVVPGVVSVSVAETMVVAGKVAPVMGMVSVSVTESVVMARIVAVVVVTGIGWRCPYRGWRRSAPGKKHNNGQQDTCEGLHRHLPQKMSCASVLRARICACRYRRTIRHPGCTAGQPMPTSATNGSRWAPMYC